MAQMPFSPCGDATNVAQCDDQSVKILYQIFGDPIEKLVTGQDPSAVTTMNVLASMFSVFNSGLLIVGSILISFIVIMGAINSSNDGEVLGKTWSAWWTPARIGFGALALLPATSGYSFIQLMIMLFSLWGVGFANSLFETGIKSSLEATPTMMRDAVASADGMPDFGVRSVAKNYVYVIYCQQVLNSTLKTYWLQSNQYPSIGIRSDGQPDSTKTASEKGIGSQLTYIYSDRNVETNVGAGAAVCGTVVKNTYTAISSSASGKDASDSALEQALLNASNEVQEIKSRHIERMMQKLDAYVASWPSSLRNSTEANWSAVSAAQYNVIVNETEEAIRSEVSANASSSNSALGQALDALQGAITKGGWANAGGWFQKVGLVQAQISDMYPKQIVSIRSTVATNSLPSGAASEEVIALMLTAPESMLRRAAAASNYAAANTTNPNLDEMFIPGKASLDIANVQADFDSKLSLWSTSVMKTIVGTMLGTKNSGSTLTWACGDTGVMGGSIIRMQCVGNLMSNIHAGLITTDAAVKTGFTVVRIWGGTLSAGKILGTGADLDKVLNPIWDWIGAVLAMIQVMVTRYLGILAFYFAVLIPAYPYIVFITVVVAWILAVLQSLVAAPLWAMMFVTPDKSFVGSQQQGLLLILALFVRPALAIIGLFAAMIIADPVINYVTMAFFSMREATISATTSGWLSTLTQMTTFFWWLCAFALTLVPILYMVFGLATGLPDQVLKWIGAGISDLGESGAINAARAGVAAAGSAYIGTSGSAAAAGRGVLEAGAKGREDMARQKAAGEQNKQLMDALRGGGSADDPGNRPVNQNAQGIAPSPAEGSPEPPSSGGSGAGGGGSNGGQSESDVSSKANLPVSSGDRGRYDEAM